VQGNLVMTAAAAYIVEVSPTAADRTNVTGTASLSDPNPLPPLASPPAPPDSLI
jgi:hypothetical protein